MNKSTSHEPDAEVDALAYRVIGALIEVHKETGPGLSEAMYENAVCIELSRRQIPFKRQVYLPVKYKGEPIGEARIDLLIDEKLIVELKACEELMPVHRAQLITYLQLTGLQLGLLVNFNKPILADGIKRVVRT